MEMLVGELVEIVGQNPDGVVHLWCPFAVLDLEKETFPQVSRTYSCRLEILDYLKHLKHFLLVSLDIRPE